MSRLTENKIILVTRKTRLDELIARFNTVDQARFYVEHLGADFSDYQAEDVVYKNVVKKIEVILAQLGLVQVLERSFLPNFIFGKKDLVVVVGQDGLVANTLKYLTHQPVVAVNPDPQRWDGVLLPFHLNDVELVMRDLLNMKHNLKEITFAKIALNDGQSMYGVNDIFIGPKSHTSARYQIELGTQHEQQCSSGIIISTGLGSTGWLRSILTGAQKIIAPDKQSTPKEIQSDWSSDYLWYNVREPFPSNTTGTDLVFGKITKDKQMILTSLMPHNGVIFSDGIEADFLHFNSGTKATIGIAEKRGYLVV